jgi:DNA-binding transcriptional LysR family regulator
LPIQQDTLIAEHVRTEPLRVALPKDHPLTQCRRITLKDLADQPLIALPRRFTPGLYDLIVGTCQKAGFNLQTAHEVDSTAAALMFVQANLGYAFCVASLEVKSNDIVYRPLQEQEIQVRYGLVYKRDPRPAVVDSFLSVVRQVARKAPSVVAAG